MVEASPFLLAILSQIKIERYTCVKGGDNKPESPSVSAFFALVIIARPWHRLKRATADLLRLPIKKIAHSRSSNRRIPAFQRITSSLGRITVWLMFTAEAVIRWIMAAQSQRHLCGASSVVDDAANPTRISQVARVCTTSHFATGILGYPGTVLFVHPATKRRIARRVHRVARLTRGCQQRVTGAPNPPFCPREYYIPTLEDPSSDQRQEARTIGVSRLEAYLLWKSLARRSKIASWQLGEEQRGSSERPITSAAT